MNYFTNQGNFIALGWMRIRHPDPDPEPVFSEVGSGSANTGSGSVSGFTPYFRKISGK
jgi:hypothetical protein